MPRIGLLTTTTALALLTLLACKSVKDAKDAKDAVDTYEAKAKTAEAKVKVAILFDGASAYFQSEQFDPGSMELTPHGCPGGPGAIDSGVTPPLDFDCNAGPGHRCVPTAKPSGPGEYAIDQWDTEIWKGLNFVMEEGHYFHYRFVAQNDPSGDDGYGTCQFTAQAFGDLDGDGVFSTFERVGVAEVYGVNAALGLYIDQELE